MHATPKITKRIRDLANMAYDSHGYLRDEFRDDHGRGSFRSVLIENGIAIKFARNSDYASHNREEWNAWRKLPKEVQKITAKPFCISACGKVMAVELVSRTLYEDYLHHGRDDYATDQSEFNSKLEMLLRANGFSACDIGHMLQDNHANNIGIRDNGDLCWIDYASV